MQVFKNMHMLSPSTLMKVTECNTFCQVKPCAHTHTPNTPIHAVILMHIYSITMNGAEMHRKSNNKNNHNKNAASG